jgi:hypothetical protein
VTSNWKLGRVEILLSCQRVAVSSLSLWDSQVE